MTVPPPQAFGRYELLERVSAGGMAEVFRARDTKRGTVVALKRILPDIAADEDFVQMFEDEARIASQLEHPHIARTLDYGHVGEVYYIAFEYVDGRDLRNVFDRCRKLGQAPPFDVLLYIFTRIGEGLSYAHSRKDATGEPVYIVHRDVSPHNIVISFKGDVKLIDFGIAKAAGRLSRTQAGEIKGKFGYMSPEQIAGDEVDQRTDVFSLGICMWELLTLKRLFEAPNEVLVLEKIRSTTILPPSSLNPRVPPGLDRVVCKALAKNVDERYRSAKELYRDLNSLTKDTNTLATREQIAHYMRRTFPEAGWAPESSIYDDDDEGDGDDLATEITDSRVQETVAMAAENKGGSDLDVFEGLGKKNSSRPPTSGMNPVPRNGPPPPPPSGAPARTASTIPPATLRGVNHPVSPPTPTPGSARNPPPPPPGRGALPIVVPPPTRSSAPTKPGGSSSSPGANAGSLDMDWDDDNEETHIYEKDQSKSSSSMPAARPAKPPVQAVPQPSAPPPSSVPGKRTLIGVSNPLLQPPPPPPPPPGPPPSGRSAPPPPPPSSVGGAFARASSIPAATPGPAYPPPPPPPTIDPRPSPRAMPSGAPTQGNTVPLPMPGARPAYPPSARPAPPPPSMPALPPPPPANRMMEATALVRPPPSSRVGFVIMGVTAIVVALVLAFLFVPRTGSVVVRALDSRGTDTQHVTVYVDGKVTPCATSPCTLDQLTPGAHFVKVAADGFDSAEQTVNIEARKQAAVDFNLSGGVGTGTGTGFKVGGTQTAAHVSVDERDIGPLPAEVHDLTPGSHKIRISGGDRYETVDKNVTVAKDEFLDLGAVTLKVIKGKATITLGTPGAKVYLVSGTDRRELPAMPISVDIDTSKQWSLVASKFGFSDYNQPISFDDGQAEKTFNVSLDPKPVAAAPVAAAPVAAPRPAPAPRPPPAPAPASNDESAASSGGGGQGFLNINSIPAASIVLDGKPIGNTPKLKVPVSAGSHTVLFVNADEGFKKTITVSVGAGETKPAIAKGD